MVVYSVEKGHVTWHIQLPALLHVPVPRDLFRPLPKNTTGSGLLRLLSKVPETLQGHGG